MGLFNNNKKKSDFTYATVQYELTELERKIKNGEPMTQAEYAAYNKEQTKDLSNKILRVFGVFALLIIVILTVGCFLYPFSLFNLFGTNDKFWDCWRHMQYHISARDLELIKNWYESRGMSFEVVLDSEGKMGWASVSDIMNVAFWGDASAKLNFVALGAWTAVLVATIGLVGLVIVTAYVVAYNIKDLISVIRHIGKRAAVITADVTLSAAESVAASIQSDKKASKKKGGRKQQKQLFEDNGTEDLKSEVVDEKKETRRNESDISNLSSEEMDRLLSGESLDEVKTDENGQKSLF